MVFAEECGRVKGHFGPINTCVPVFIYSLYSVLCSSLIWVLMPILLCSLAVHPTGKCYASGGEDGFVRVHHFDESYYKAKPYGDFEIDD